jgi:tetratricopeptide (TPR) repeat protein
MDTEAVLTRALDHADEGDWAGAATILREALGEGEPVAALLCWLGVAERELGMDGVAYERFKQALALDPEDPVILATAGNALAWFDDPDAESALRTAAMLGRDVPFARWTYGAYLTREGLLEQARVELDAALELAPEDATALYESGVWYLAAGRGDEGVSALYRAVEVAPDDGWARVVLGLALIASGRLDEALVELDRGARLRDDDAEAQVVAALAFASEGHEDRAWEMLERGRLSAEGTDVLAVNEAEERMNESPEAALDLLRDTVAPSVLRERLGARP